MGIEMITTLRRATGFRWFERSRSGWEARFDWGEVTGSWGLGLGLRLAGGPC